MHMHFEDKKLEVATGGKGGTWSLPRERSNLMLRQGWLAPLTYSTWRKLGFLVLSESDFGWIVPYTPFFVCLGRAAGGLP